MAQESDLFELLKTYRGLIHRRPMFITDRLDVDSYHLSFLSKEGEALDDDAPIPDFLEQLPAILPSISDRQKALLSMPESWRETLFEKHNTTFKLILDINSHPIPQSVGSKHFGFASHAHPDENDVESETLLIDIKQHDANSLQEHLPEWRVHHKTLCATNVDDQGEYQLCKSSKLDLLQGQFYTAPSISDRQKVSPALHTLTELLVKLQDPEVEAEDLAITINHDVSLSYKLLRLINSAFFGLPREVSSVQQAIVMLGHKKIKTWASLLSLTGIDDKPVELRVVAMMRARMCELLAKYYKGQPEVFFAAGLFSTLDALMDAPLSNLAEKLPLSAELMSALIDSAGPAGNALRDVLNYEKGDWAAIDSSPIPAEVLARTYLDAIVWAKELNSQLQS